MKKSNIQNKRPSSLQSSKLSSALNSYLSLLKNNNQPKVEHSPQQSISSVKKRPTPSPNSRGNSKHLFQSKGDISVNHSGLDTPQEDRDIMNKKFDTLKQPLDSVIKKHKKYDTLKETNFGSEYGINSTVRKPNEIPCIRHPDKRAKYTSTSKGAYSYFCSKCAISYALEGYKVEEIFDDHPMPTLKHEKSENVLSARNNSMQMKTQENKESENSNGNLDKSIQLNDFLKNLDIVYEQHSIAKNYLTDKRNVLNSYLQKQIIQCENVFDKIQEILEHEKSALINKVSQNHHLFYQTMEVMERDLNRDVNEMANIKLDIEVNMDNILKNMELEPLKIILSKYDEKLREYSRVLQLSKEKTIPIQSVNFQGNKEDIIDYLKLVLNKSFEISQRDVSFFEDENGIPDRKVNSSIYVSFENKEFFAEARKPVVKTYPLEIIDTNPIQRNNSKSVDINSKSKFCSPQGNLSSLKTIKVLKGSSSTPRIIPKNSDRNLSTDSSKYLHLLDRIQINQENTNNSILESQQKMIGARTSSQNRSGPSLNENLDTSNMYYGNKEEEKKYENFYSFIEKKLIDEDSKKPNEKEGESYQKTLFSSPQFKDVEIHENLF